MVTFFTNMKEKSETIRSENLHLFHCLFNFFVIPKGLLGFEYLIFSLNYVVLQQPAGQEQGHIGLPEQPGHNGPEVMTLDITIILLQYMKILPSQYDTHDRTAPIETKLITN